MNGHYPWHVSLLISQLQNRQDCLETLMQFEHYLVRDDTLHFVFIRLGYSSESGRFTRRVDREQAIKVLEGEYRDAESTNSSEPGFRDELLRTLNEDREFALSPELLGTMEDPKPKGLKLLSSRVKRVLLQQGPASYKSITEALMAHLDSESKDQKNILRRVYDALNVLISVGAISKKRKLYEWQGTPHFQTETAEALQDTLQAQRERNWHKRQKALALARKFSLLSSLINRNRGKPMNDACIHLPSVVVATSVNSRDSIKVQFTEDLQQVTIKFPRRVTLLEGEELVSYGLLASNASSCQTSSFSF